jgi:hypothetical protein
VAIDRLPSGSFRGRLMIDGRRYTAPLPTEADARIWEIETRAAVAGRCRAASVTFAAYAANWLSGFIEDAPDRARFEVALEDRLVPVLGEVRLLEVLDADRDQLHRRLVDVGGGDDGPARECLRLILEDATDELRAGTLEVRALVGSGGSGLESICRRLASACR